MCHSFPAICKVSPKMNLLKTWQRGHLGLRPSKKNDIILMSPSHLTLGVVKPSRRMENEKKEEPIGQLLHGERCDTPLWPACGKNVCPQIKHGELVVKEATPGEKQEACGETFSENSPFSTRGGGEVPSSILREWAFCHSRRGCHISILGPPRMGSFWCDNPS